ncbi:hypothetical protein NliqN6_0848 [Naganishia liquefaciens]|uniref:Mitogen-activated protein kinase n=1 Tax=Naganishia liquefaciens TaxID=104408 RepID=A0A8H3YE59_9TREE|nr:hypothetical protein NliqN6_0848 [Naganishia liquefaciens]
MSESIDSASGQQTTGHSGSSQPIQIIGFDIEEPQGAVIPRRRSSASSHKAAQNRNLIRNLAKASSAASTPSIPQGMPVDHFDEAISPPAQSTTVHHVRPRKAKSSISQTLIGNTAAPMLEPPVSPSVVGLSSGSEAGGSSCPSGYRSGSEGATTYGAAYSTAPTSVNNTAASTPAHGALSGKFPPKTQQSPAPGSVSNPSALGTEPYAASQPGASRLAQAAAANMVKRGMVVGQGNSGNESEGAADHPLSERALSKRGYQSHILFNHVFHLENRWSGLRELGQGAYGLVISAQDSLSGETIAIKMLTRVFDKAILARRCLREITLLRHLNGHENITGLIDLDVVIDDFNEIYMFIEPMEADLHQIIRSGQKLSNSHIQYFLYQILRGMKYIHSANVIHRDLKPGNLLVNADCELKICDFGLARGFRPDPSEWDPNSQGPGGPMTEYVATRWYRAPEIMLSYKRYSTGIDVWSIGCILAELLGGKPIFKGKDYIEQLNLILQILGMPDEATLTAIGSEKACAYIRTLPVYEKVPFETLYPDADPEALDLLEKLLRFDPAERISVAEALKHPYMAPYHDETDEPDCPTVFDKWEEVEGTHTLEEFKQIIRTEVEEFRKEVRTVEEWEGQSDSENRRPDVISEEDVTTESIAATSPIQPSEWEGQAVPFAPSATSTPASSVHASLQGTPRGSISHAKSSPSPAKRALEKTLSSTPQMAISPNSDGDRGRSLGSSQPPSSSSTLRTGRRRSSAGFTDPFTRRPVSMFGLGLGMSGMTALNGSIQAAGGAAGEGPGISASLPRSHGKRASISGDLEHRFSKSRTSSTSSAVRPLVRTLSSLSMADLPLIHHQNTADPPPMSVSPADAPPSEAPLTFGKGSRPSTSRHHSQEKEQPFSEATE